MPYGWTPLTHNWLNVCLDLRNHTRTNEHKEKCGFSLRRCFAYGNKLERTVYGLLVYLYIPVNKHVQFGRTQALRWIIATAITTTRRPLHENGDQDVTLLFPLNIYSRASGNFQHFCVCKFTSLHSSLLLPQKPMAPFRSSCSCSSGNNNNKSLNNGSKWKRGSSDVTATPTHDRSPGPERGIEITTAMPTVAARTRIEQRSSAVPLFPRGLLLEALWTSQKVTIVFHLYACWHYNFSSKTEYRERTYPFMHRCSARTSQ